MALSESELDTKIQKQTKLDELKKVRQKVQDKAKQLQDKLLGSALQLNIPVLEIKRYTF